MSAKSEPGDAYKVMLIKNVYFALKSTISRVICLFCWRIKLFVRDYSIALLIVCLHTPFHKK